jgi:TRAP-type C4-dicarboxylate transport system substrate-binding protein
MKGIRGLLASALVLASASTLPAQAQEVTLRLHSFMFDGSYMHKKFIDPWCERIKEQSNGRMACQIHYSMQLGGSPVELIEQVRDGIVDIAYGNPGYKPGAYLASEVFELPFMLTDLHDAARAMWDYHQAHAGPEYEGIKFLAVAPADFPIIQTKDKVVRTKEDMVGVKLRSAGRYGAKVLEALGALPVQMSAGQITESLNKGVIDGAYLPWSAVRLLKLTTTMKHFTDFADDQRKMYTTVQVLVMNQGSYDRLPDDLKKVIDDNIGPEQSAQFTDAFTSTAAEDKKLVEEAGGDIYVLPNDEYERWVASAENIASEWVADANAKGLDGQALLDAAKAALAKYN